jgi:osmotically-inducible protein OsmY
MFTDLLKSDTEIKTEVLDELKFEPTIKTSDIGVLVKDGTVTLNGNVSTYSEKYHAVTAVKRLAGVKGIADEIRVKLLGSPEHDDTEIARVAAIQLASTAMLPQIKVTVSDGWITMDGSVEWFYQKGRAEDVVHHLPGVRGVINLVDIKPQASALGIEKSIESAFLRNALLDSKNVRVLAVGGAVTLSGSVHSYAELEEAGRMARNASGVSAVDNQIRVR